ncbi:OPT oligopeptide transporter protein-domain-containing protein [Lipomyces kononenkoae]
MSQYEKTSGVVEAVVGSASSDSDFSGEKKDAFVTAEVVTEENPQFMYTTEEKEKIYAFIDSVENLRDILDEDPDYILENMKFLTLEESLKILKDAAEYFKEDVIFPGAMMNRIDVLLQGEQSSGMESYYYQLETRLQAALLKFDSPYPEVRAVVRPTDDPSMPCETFRSYAVGIFWVCCASFVNQMYAERQPSIVLNATVLQILIYPSGKFISKVLPAWTLNIFGCKVPINPGPWTFKEQMFVTIMTNVGGGAMNFFHYGLVMRLGIFFNNEWVQYGFLFLMSFVTQFFGFGLAGIMRRYVIYETKSVFPTILPILQLNRALLLPEPKQNINGWTISKYKLFWTVFVAMFVYFFLPDYLFTALSTFSWITWIAPNNKTLAFITGSKMGLGINPWTTFDWSVINYATPLIVPFFSAMNRYIGVWIGAFIIIGMYWSNYKYTAYFPPNNSNVYDRTGAKYNLTKVLTNNLFDEEKYQNYSQVYIGAGNLTMLGSFYALYTCAFCYIMLSEWKTIKDGCKGFYRSLRDRKLSNYDMFDDPFSRTMRMYKEVPDWWFLVTLIIAFAVGIGAIVGYPTRTPVWAVVVVILVSIALLIPTMIIFSTTGYLIPGDTLTVIIAGYMVHGNPVASLICRVFGYNTDEQAETFIGDQKLAHYARMAPRSVFRAQMTATLLQCFITTGAVTWLISNTPDLCTSTQSARLVCTFPNQLYSNTVLLGVIGPHRTYDLIYPALKYGFLIGAIVGISFWALRRRYIKFLKYIHPVLILSGINRYGATYNLSYYTPGIYFSFMFMYFIRRRYLAWWTKYNYILSSGLTAGMAFSGILIFFALQYTGHSVKWWGTQVQLAGVDGAGTATLLKVPAGGFGPPVGSWQ